MSSSDRQEIGNSPHSIAIGFDAKRAFFNKSGLGNYSRNLLRAFSEFYPGNSYFLFTPKTGKRFILENEENFRIVSPKGAGRLSGPLWRTFMTGGIKRQGVDIFHGLSQELPLRINKARIRSVVTVHDLIFLRFPRYYKRIDVEIYRRKIAYACKVADHIVAISEQTRKDITEFLGIDPAKISVIYQGCNPVFRKKFNKQLFQEVRSKYNLPERYLLYVGTIEERKNLAGILKAMNEAGIDIPLVAVGRKKEHYFSEICRYITVNGMKNILFPEEITNDELPALYQNAECFLYPSFFEGFGIPVIEALVSNTPVITSNSGCLFEAGGPGSLYVDPYNSAAIAEAILQVAGNPEKRDDMIRRGAEYSEKFRDDKIAGAYMDLYFSLLK